MEKEVCTTYFTYLETDRTDIPSHSLSIALHHIMLSFTYLLQAYLPT